MALVRLKLDLTKDVKKFLDGLQAKQFNKQFKQVAGKILSLMDNPMPKDCAQLHGYSYYRVDIEAVPDHLLC